MIGIPVLISLIFLFPMVANLFMGIWADSRRTLALQDAASHLASVIQQLYFSLNHSTVPANTTLRELPRLSPLIENNYYEGKATLRTILEPASNSSKILELKLTLARVGTSVTASVTLGSNVLWQESTFISNSTDAWVIAQKFTNETINLRFGE